MRMVRLVLLFFIPTFWCAPQFPIDSCKESRCQDQGRDGRGALLNTILENIGLMPTTATAPTPSATATAPTATATTASATAPTTLATSATAPTVEFFKTCLHNTVISDIFGCQCGAFFGGEHCKPGMVCTDETKCEDAPPACPTDTLTLHDSCLCGSLVCGSAYDCKSGSCQLGKTMKTIDMFARGYNIMKGNPITIDNSVDPGYQGLIFDISYSKGGRSPDGRYLEPDGTSMTYSEGCTLTFASTEIAGVNSYQKSLDVKITVSTSVDMWWLYSSRFSASVEYKKIEKETSTNQNLFTQSHASCSAYQVQTNTYQHPSFSQNFITAVKTLTDVYDQSIYLTFIEEFGTHYIRHANYGSIYGKQSTISRESWAKLVEDGFNVGALASVSALVATFSANAATDIQKVQAEKFNTEKTSTWEYTKGSLPPQDGNQYTWMHETKDAPSPTSLELRSIAEAVKLLNGSSDINVSQKQMDHLNKALTNYCIHLKEQSQVSSCSAPGPDPPLPTCSEKICSWTPWVGNTPNGKSFETKSCGKGQYVTWMQMSKINAAQSEQIQFGCSHGETYYASPGSSPIMTEKANISCTQKSGFSQLKGWWLSLFGICDIEIQCYDDSQTQYLGGDDGKPSWEVEHQVAQPSDWVTCPSPQKIVGLQTKYKDGVGITQFRFQCA